MLVGNHQGTKCSIMSVTMSGHCALVRHLDGVVGIGWLVIHGRLSYR